MKGSSVFQLRAPLGAFVAVGVCVCMISIVSVSSLEAVSNMVATSGNETVIIDNLNVTGQLLKRAGEFASRALWVRKGKFVLPAGTILQIAPKITIPAFRRKAFKGGLNSDVQATWFIYLNCDKMGFTHDMHPFPFDRPPFYPFGPLMRPIESKDYPGAEDKDKEKDKMKPQKHPHPHFNPHHHHGTPEDLSYVMDPLLKGPPSHMTENGEDSYKNLKSDTVYTFFPIHKRTGGAQQKWGRGKPIGSSRKPRSVMSLPPPEKLPGGERAILLPSIENMMGNFGFQGRGCMLRAICEIHEFPLQEGYGLLGEMIALFFSISQSPYAESHMPEYLKAEGAGRAGDCAEYRKQCARSIFKFEVEKKHHEDSDVDTNEVPVSLYRSKYEDDEL